MTPAAAARIEQQGRAHPGVSAPVAPTSSQDGLVAPAKALRLLCMLWDGLEELHRITPDDPARRALIAAHRAALVEVASTVSDPLIDELLELRFAPLDPDATVGEIRVAQAQLFGWLNGLILADERFSASPAPTTSDVRP
jgi:Bacterial proteasome activator